MIHDFGRVIAHRDDLFRVIPGVSVANGCC